MKEVLRHLFHLALLLALPVVVHAQASGVPSQHRRPRGEGLLYTQSANTMGSGSIWAGVQAVGFLWDDDEEGDPKLFPFPHLRIDAGTVDFVSLILESRLVSYPNPAVATFPQKLQFGYLAGGLRATIPNNSDLRYNGLGLELLYRHSFVRGFPSIAGFRTGGTGFSPEGWIVEGGVFDWKVLFERDYLARHAGIPVRALVNVGMKIPLEKEFRSYAQYQVALGLMWSSLTADAFVEYSLEAFVNNSVEPKVFDEVWSGWSSHKVWKVAWTENPMYLTLGGRLRLPFGVHLHGAVPVLLSVNWGSDITYRGDTRRIKADFPGETDMTNNYNAFDPWYARWKLVVGLTAPLRFRQSGAEMRRTFLLMRNQPQRARIDIDQRLRDLERSGESEEDDDTRERLEQIRRRREEILDPSSGEAP